MNDKKEINQRNNDRFLPSGKMIDNRFEIKEPIRKTSGCIVYRANDKTNNIDKALLIIPPIIKADFEAMDSLRESAQLLKWLNHPYIARYYGLHTSGEYTFFEMEFVPGKSVKRKKFESPNKIFSENMAKWGALQILEGLSFAHKQNILHRNIKPQKIIFTTNGQVKLIDFGISDALRNAMAMVRDVTSRSAILFMPPEQLKGRNLTIQSDIYSLGATLYYLLDGKPPFHHGDIYYQILNEKPEPIEGVSSEFNYILQICLAKNISDRFDSCEQMIKEIKHLRSPVEDSKLTETTNVPLTQPEKKPVQPEPKIEKKQIEYNDKIFDENFLSIISNKIKQNIAILSWTSLLFLIVLSIVLFNTVFYKGNTGKTTSVVATLDPNSEAAKKMIKTLIASADDLFEKKRFIAPPQDNAFEIYQKVLRIDPQQTHALSQINKIKSNYYDNIKLHLKNYQLAEAEKEIDTCKGVFGSDQELLASEKEYDEKLKSAESIPIKIEILNGAGVSGIAYTLSNYLKNEKYSIVLRENYRVNGQIHWNVKNTQLIGSIPINKRVKRLEQILNVEYERNVLKNRQSRQANILIIIGKDYDKINPLK